MSRKLVFRVYDINGDHITDCDSQTDAERRCKNNVGWWFQPVYIDVENP